MQFRLKKEIGSLEMDEKSIKLNLEFNDPKDYALFLDCLAQSYEETKVRQRTTEKYRDNESYTYFSNRLDRIESLLCNVYKQLSPEDGDKYFERMKIRADRFVESKIRNNRMFDLTYVSVLIILGMLLSSPIWAILFK